MDGAAFGQASAGCVRVCFAADEATLDAACERLRRFCEEDLPALTRARARSQPGSVAAARPRDDIGHARLDPPGFIILL